jgi:5-methylthioadenosine/S-adenosylhomocysteine deaminase
MRHRSPCLHDDAPGFVEMLVQRARANAGYSVMVCGEWVHRERRFTSIDREAAPAEFADEPHDPAAAGPDRREETSCASCC